MKNGISKMVFKISFFGLSNDRCPVPDEEKRRRGRQTEVGIPKTDCPMGSSERELAAPSKGQLHSTTQTFSLLPLSERQQPL
jgi:hypothetical protein